MPVITATGISKYSPTSVLIACSQISVHLNYVPEGQTTPNKELTAKYIPFLFQASLVPRVRKAHALDLVIFFQGQLRAIAAEITRLPPMPDESLPTIENHELGELMLRALLSLTPAIAVIMSDNKYSV